MGKLFLLLVLAITVSRCGDCTRMETGPYTGDPNATEPYHVTSMMDPMLMGSCDSMGCQYSIVAVVNVHNPTNEWISFNVQCAFYVDDYEAANSQRLDNLDGRHSARVELQEQVTVADPATVSVVCRMDYSYE